MSLDNLATIESKLISNIQTALVAENIEAWLFYFFHNNDDIALRILELSEKIFFSRRWFYLIPKQGTPVKLVHRIEDHVLDSLPGDKKIYVGWSQLETELNSMLKSYSEVAMQYSPSNAIPYISRIDAGTIELIKSFGVSIKSSADLVSLFEATCTEEQKNSHLIACKNLREIVFSTLEYIKSRLSAEESCTEYLAQQYILNKFDEYDMTTNSPPIVAVNAHSGMPHYQPTKENHWPIKKGDFLLIDLWAKLKKPANSIYGDITWTAYLGEQVPEKFSQIFSIVAGARDAALNLVRKRIAAKEIIYGYEVDDAARNFITEAGFGERFLHRTGHSIGQEVHANGANMDNLETKDRRKILANTCFSIEPGIYLEEFGIRSEIDVYVTENEVNVANELLQTSIIPIQI